MWSFLNAPSSPLFPDSSVERRRSRRANFCAEQTTRRCGLTEQIPAGPTITRMRELTKRHRMALIVPIYEVEQEGVYYNTAAVIDQAGNYLGKWRHSRGDGRVCPQHG